MPLTQEQIQKFNDWQRAKGVKPGCPACGHADWAFGNILANAHVFVPEGIEPNSITVPTIQVVCNHCAYVMSFAAAQIGLLP